MAATLMIHISKHLKGQPNPHSTVTSFISPTSHIWDLKDNITKVLLTNLFNISTSQPLSISHLDIESTTFHVSWNNSNRPSLPNSEILAGDVKEFMEILENRSWRDVLEFKLMFDPEVKTGLKTMSEGERAWALISKGVIERRGLGR
ncbi:hypothetical protein IFR05_006673 [Cadophora sp. M221]|nr:hypothetical protein IFR05_006673 [Cadophora sp. M221]